MIQCPDTNEMLDMEAMQWVKILGKLSLRTGFVLGVGYLIQFFLTD